MARELQAARPGGPAQSARAGCVHHVRCPPGRPQGPALLELPYSAPCWRSEPSAAVRFRAAGIPQPGMTPAGLALLQCTLRPDPRALRRV